VAISFRRKQALDETLKIFKHQDLESRIERSRTYPSINNPCGQHQNFAVGPSNFFVGGHLPSYNPLLSAPESSVLNFYSNGLRF
jgi:hypothetical protein